MSAVEGRHLLPAARCKGARPDEGPDSGSGVSTRPHHEGYSSHALNLWLNVAPRASVLCSELCAALNLRDYPDRVPRVVADGEIVDLGSHRHRFLMTPQVNQWG